MGVLMFLSFLGLFAKLWKDNVDQRRRPRVEAHMGDMLRGNKAEDATRWASTTPGRRWCSG
jgi:hypothetical protein